VTAMAFPLPAYARRQPRLPRLRAICHGLCRPRGGVASGPPLLPLGAISAPCAFMLMSLFMSVQSGNFIRCLGQNLRRCFVARIPTRASQSTRSRKTSVYVYVVLHRFRHDPIKLLCNYVRTDPRHIRVVLKRILLTYHRCPRKVSIQGWDMSCGFRLLKPEAMGRLRGHG
jgi:hypothetical protein